MIRSARGAISCSLCSTRTIVRPSFMLSCLMICITSAAPAGSSWLIGSSSTSIFGIIASMLAMQTRCFCPPESVPVAANLCFDIPTISRLSRTRCSISGFGRHRFSGPNAISSSTTVENIWSSGFWNTSPVIRASSFMQDSAVSMPFMRILPRSSPPDSCGIIPFKVFKSVLLPHPVGPASSTNSPFLIVISIPASVGSSLAP